MTTGSVVNMGSSSAVALGDSVFNYDDYTEARFLHYFQQFKHVMELAPRSILEIGPGDHAVCDMLRRKGMDVETYDMDPALRPTYLGDIRDPLVTPRTYDLVMACEVLEHMPARWTPAVLRNIARAVAPGGRALISLPYSTIRLFPPRPDYGRVVSCEGRLPTGIPIRYYDYARWPVRVLYRLARGDRRRALQPPGMSPQPEDRFDLHHWDLGYGATSVRRTARVFAEVFDVERIVPYRNTNCVFYVLSRKASSG